MSEILKQGSKTERNHDLSPRSEGSDPSLDPSGTGQLDLTLTKAGDESVPLMVSTNNEGVVSDVRF